MSVLEREIDDLIAKERNWPLSEVTLKRINELRDSADQSQPRLVFGTKYGGYNHCGLRIVDKVSAELLDKKATLFLRDFLSTPSRKPGRWWDRLSPKVIKFVEYLGNV